jgi:mannose-6-phosphate isomerase-like protein (cupin superfamily)
MQQCIVQSLQLHTDQRRTLALCPQWCDTQQAWLVREEAHRVYEAAFGTLAEGESLQLWLDGRDVTLAHFLTSYHAERPTHSVTLLDTQLARLSVRRIRHSALLDLSRLVAHRGADRRQELMRTETAQFVLQRVPVGGAVGEQQDTLPERHPGVTQLIQVLAGVAEVTLSSDALGQQVLERLQLTPLQCAVVPPDTYHYVRQLGPVELVFFSVYSPPEPEAEENKK